MKHLPIITIAFLLTGTCARSSRLVLQADAATETSTTNETHWEDPALPPFMTNYMDSASWYADTICVVDGRVYYFAEEDHGRMNVIYTNEGILCEDPALWYNRADTISTTKFSINTAAKAVVVDFAQPQTLKNLQSLMPAPPAPPPSTMLWMNSGEVQVKRFTKDFFTDFANFCMYHLDVDYPAAGSADTDNVRRWLAKTVSDSYWVSQYDNNYKTLKRINRAKYEGDPCDAEALCRFAADKYFSLKKAEYSAPEDEDIWGLYYSLSLRLVSTNGRYWSYQKQHNEYDGGMHGYFTEEIVSFDPASNCEIDWNYLFVPKCEEEVLALFYKAVERNSRFNFWENPDDLEAIKTHFQNNALKLRKGHIILPQPGLTDDGVVFSYQPYEISGWAEGTFHFCIPYEDLKPYLTTKAKALLGSNRARTVAALVETQAATV